MLFENHIFISSSSLTRKRSPIEFSDMKISLLTTVFLVLFSTFSFTCSAIEYGPLIITAASEAECKGQPIGATIIPLFGNEPGFVCGRECKAVSNNNFDSKSALEVCIKDYDIETGLNELFKDYYMIQQFDTTCTTLIQETAVPRTSFGKCIYAQKSSSYMVIETKEGFNSTWYEDESCSKSIDRYQLKFTDLNKNKCNQCGIKIKDGGAFYIQQLDDKCQNVKRQLNIQKSTLGKCQQLPQENSSYKLIQEKKTKKLTLTLYNDLKCAKASDQFAFPVSTLDTNKCTKRRTKIFTIKPRN
jgi:hypothetical protein